MSNGNLIAWLLDFDFLEADESAALDLHHELSFALVLNALGAGAFN
jgi:hypothetical protein